MKVRRAELDDIGNLVELLKVMGDESPVYSKFKPDYARQYRVFMRMILSPETIVLITEDKTGMFIGHIEDALWFDGTYAWEDILFVLPEFRKSSRAVTLMKAFEEWAKENKTVEMRLGLTTEVEVESTFDFFERLGYTPSGAFFRKET